MNMQNKLFEIGIVPVVVINDAESAVPLAKALVAGDIPTAEITFRTDAAEQAIKNISAEVPDILVGAGTVTSVEMAQRAVDAGAKYIVSPGFNPKVVQWCLDNNVAVFPGVTCPTQIEQAMEMGLETLKFFPAESSGGVPMLKNFASPYGRIKFMPTGGISEKNINEYLSLKNVIACGGSFICPSAMIENREFDKITALCREAILKIHGFTILHLGINCQNAAEAENSAKMLQTMFGYALRDAGPSIFAGEQFEIMKQNGRGKNGHIAIGVNNIERAVALLKRKGFAFDESSYVKNTFIYMKDEIAGFAVHLKRI